MTAGAMQLFANPANVGENHLKVFEDFKETFFKKFL